MAEQTHNSTAAVALPGESSEKVLLHWQTHPAKAKPVITVLVVLFLTLLVTIVYVTTDHNLFFTAISTLILWGSLTQFFMPTTFELTDSKVRVKYVVNKIEKEWSQYRSYYVDKNGVLLSPFVRPSRLENFRGLYVRFNGNRDDVMNVVKSKIAFEQ